jgi:hypothetical protein
VIAANRKERLPVNQLLRKALEQRQIDFRVGQIEKVDADFLADRSQGRLFGDKSQADRRLDQARTVAVPVCVRTGFVELAAIHEAATDQDFTGFHSTKPFRRDI